MIELQLLSNALLGTTESISEFQIGCSNHQVLH